MHMSDALVSPAVAGVAALVSGAIFIVAARKVKNNDTENIIPLMGVMGAFIFAAQMINFSVPGTGSSGHIVGGVLLASILGPWAAFITLASVLLIQCLIFADGGLMALGCNIFNMGVCACLIAYPLVFRSLIRFPASMGKIMWVSILTCVVGLELGAFFVTAETELSGITALPFLEFLMFMGPIHLAIGVGEGIATGAVIYFVQKYKPALLMQYRSRAASEEKVSRIGRVLAIIAIVAAVVGISFNWVASSDPDGLEWSINKVLGGSDLNAATDGASQLAGRAQNLTAILPDYDNYFSGIIGGILVVMVTWGITSLLCRRKKISHNHHE